MTEKRFGFCVLVGSLILNDFENLGHELCVGCVVCAFQGRFGTWTHSDSNCSKNALEEALHSSYRLIF